jgi:hypothetical protein
MVEPLSTIVHRDKVILLKLFNMNFYEYSIHTHSYT